jgi:wyosine [tRNA(Phe)-imidazoG37] synthetase (radical SAM superfamily)
MEGLAFGPVPSRRLGRSVGINTIPSVLSGEGRRADQPFKACSYSCAYCQVGRTPGQRIERTAFFEPALVVQSARQVVEETRRAGGRIDYLSVVPDGEPTLDLRLGELIEGLRPLAIPVAVITNGSLLPRADVRRELALADWVSLKVDAVDERPWRRLDRPHRALRLADILDGMLAFRDVFEGCLATETMLVAGWNDDAGGTRAVADFLVRLRPDVVYLSVPTRPPADASVAPPSMERLRGIATVFEDLLPDVRCLAGDEGNAFSCSGEPAAALLGITAVHPMREEAMREFLRTAGAPWALVQGLLDRGDLVQVDYAGDRYYRKGSPQGAGGGS